MSFTKTQWQDYQAPAITAAQLNRMEEGIYNALSHSGGIRNVKEYADDNPGSATGGIAEAISSLGGSPGVIYCPPATYPISSNYTIPATVHAIVGRGAVFQVAAATTLTINGTIQAGLYQIFDCVGTGAVSFGGAVSEVYPQWWGAKGDGVTNDAAPLKAAMLTQKKVVVPHTGNPYNVGSALEMTSGTVHVEGSGGQPEIEATAEIQLFKMGDDTTAPSLVILRNLRVTGTDGTPEAGGRGIALRGVPYALLDNIVADKFTDYGISIRGEINDTATPCEVYARNIVVSNNKIQGLAITCGTKPILFDGLKAHNNTNHGIDIEFLTGKVKAIAGGLRNITIRNFVSYSNGWTGVNITTGDNTKTWLEGTGGYTRHDFRDILLENGEVYSNGTAGNYPGVQVKFGALEIINVDSHDNTSHGFSIINLGDVAWNAKVRFRDCRATGNTHSGFNVDGDSGDKGWIRYEDCESWSNTQYGFYVTAGDDWDYIKYEGCWASGNTLGTSNSLSSYDYPVVVKDCQGFYSIERRFQKGVIEADLPFDGSNGIIRLPKGAIVAKIVVNVTSGYVGGTNPVWLFEETEGSTDYMTIDANVVGYRFVDDASYQVDAADTHHANIGWLKFGSTQKGILANAGGTWDGSGGAGKWYVEYYYNLDEGA